MNTQAKVALDKQAHPERYCKEPRCLWRILSVNYPGGYKACPKHEPRINGLPLETGWHKPSLMR